MPLNQHNPLQKETQKNPSKPHTQQPVKKT